MAKRIDKIIRVLKDTSREWGNPAVTEIARKTRSPFRVLVSCVLSSRTKDEVTNKATKKLFQAANNAEKIASLPEERIEKLIYPVGFYRNKAKRIKELTQILTSTYQGKVPSDMNELLSLPGVGRKTANLVLTLGFGKPGICVDTHVHRITNRWGYVGTKNPVETESALREKLPSRYWIEFNTLLVSFGQKICRPLSPFCSRCPVEKFCEKAGVEKTR